MHVPFRKWRRVRHQQCSPVQIHCRSSLQPVRCFVVSKACQALSYLRLQEGTTVLFDAAKSSPSENGHETPLEGAALLQDPTLLRAWQAIRFVSAAAKGQWGVNGAFLAPQLLRFLPSLLKLQVTYPSWCGGGRLRCL